LNGHITHRVTSVFRLESAIGAVPAGAVDHAHFVLKFITPVKPSHAIRGFSFGKCIAIKRRANPQNTSYWKGTFAHAFKKSGIPAWFPDKNIRGQV
jgi:hypothetical protein